MRLLPLALFLFFAPQAISAEPPAAASAARVVSAGSRAITQSVQQPKPPCLDCAVEATATKDVLDLWVARGFVKPSIVKISRKTLYAGIPSAQFSRSLDLTVVAFRGAGWSDAEILRRQQRMAAILAQCGIRLSLTLAMADSYLGEMNIPGTPDGKKGIEHAIARAVPAQQRPVFFYVGKVGSGENAWANESRFFESGDPLSDTVWLNRHVETDAYRKLVDPSYSPDAHEMMHLLARVGHLNWDEKNLMAADVKLLNDRIPPFLCERATQSQLVR